MGWWSLHPMGGDSPLDEQYSVFDHFPTLEDFEFYENDWFKELKRVLEGATLEDLQEIASNVELEYVIPYTFKENGVIPKDPAMIEFLKQCLYDPDNDGYYDDETDEWIETEGYHLLNEFEAGKYGDSIDAAEEFVSEDDITKMYLQFFHKNFDAIMAGEMEELERPKGLLETIADHIEEGKTGLVNKKI